MKQLKVYVGAGNDRRDGFIHSDVRYISGIDIVCPAWKLSSHIKNIDEIYSRHMLEHLTSMEADCALIDWFNALAVGGKLDIIVPNMDYHAKQWLEAEWNEESLCNPRSNARHSFAGFWGWQQECNPSLSDYNNSYWDVHKSGYNKKRMEFLLGRIGFGEITVFVEDDIHLHAIAKKTMDKGERQVSASVRLIRADHRQRYEFSSSYLKLSDKVLDAACGVGYGSFIISKYCSSVTGVDISADAINFANTHYLNEKVNYNVLDLKNLNTVDDNFDVIVSFETFEHITFTHEFMENIAHLLHDGGKFIVSTPNQDALPFDESRFPYHVKHYTVDEMIGIIENVGLTVEEVWSQHDAVSGDLRQDDKGLFLILVARKQTNISS